MGANQSVNTHALAAAGLVREVPGTRTLALAASAAGVDEKFKEELLAELLARAPGNEEYAIAIAVVNTRKVVTLQ